MTAKIQVRRDTAANWTSNNPTLASGEIGFESDTIRFKIGDGSTAWTSLQYPTDTIPYLPSTGLTDLNNITKTGRYRFSSASGLSNIPSSSGAGTTELPILGAWTAVNQYSVGAYTDGGALLLVIRYDTKKNGATSGDFIYQELTTDGAKSASPTTVPDIPSKKWFRMWDGDVSPSGAWTSWTPLTVWNTLGDIDGQTDSNKGVDVRAKNIKATDGIELWGTGLGQIAFKGLTGNGTSYEQWRIDYLDNNLVQAGSWNNGALRITNGAQTVDFGRNSIAGGASKYEMVVGAGATNQSSGTSRFLCFGQGQFTGGLTVGAASGFNGGTGATNTSIFYGLIDARGGVTNPTVAIDANNLRIQALKTELGASTDAMNLLAVAGRISFCLINLSSGNNNTASDGTVWQRSGGGANNTVWPQTGAFTALVCGIDPDGQIVIINYKVNVNVSNPIQMTSPSGQQQDMHLIIAFRTNVP